MDLSKYWRIILAYRRMILILSISSCVTALGLTYVLPEKYSSTSVVLVRPQEKIKFAQAGSGKEILDYPVSQLSPIDAPSKTYIAVIQSRAVVEKIVHALEAPRPRTRYRIGLATQGAAILKRVLPDRLLDMVVARM